MSCTEKLKVNFPSTPYLCSLILSVDCVVGEIRTQEQVTVKSAFLVLSPKQHTSPEDVVFDAAAP